MVADFSLDGTPEGLAKYIQEIADYYRMTPEEVKKHLNTEQEENSSFWM